MDDDQVSALVVLLPGHPAIAVIRQAHDHAWPRWPEHVTLQYPVPVGALFAVADQGCHVNLTLDRLDAFVLQKSTATKPGRVSFHLRPDASSEAVLQALFQKYVIGRRKQPFAPHLTLAQCTCAEAPALRQQLTTWLNEHGPFVWKAIAHVSLLQRPRADSKQPFVESLVLPL
jgi:hypothetical protein